MWDFSPANPFPCLSSRESGNLSRPAKLGGADSIPDPEKK